MKNSGRLTKLEECLLPLKGYKSLVLRFSEQPPKVKNFTSQKVTDHRQISTKLFKQTEKTEPIVRIVIFDESKENEMEHLMEMVTPT